MPVYKVFQPGEPLKWPKVKPGSAEEALLARKETIFALQRKLDQPELQRKATKAAAAVASKRPNTGHERDAYTRFCEAADIPPWPVSTGLSALCYLAKAGCGRPYHDNLKRELGHHLTFSKSIFEKELEYVELQQLATKLGLSQEPSDAAVCAAGSQPGLARSAPVNAQAEQSKSRPSAAASGTTEQRNSAVASLRGGSSSVSPSGSAVGSKRKYSETSSATSCSPASSVAPAPPFLTAFCASLDPSLIFLAQPLAAFGVNSIADLTALRLFPPLILARFFEAVATAWKKLRSTDKSLPLLAAAHIKLFSKRICL